ncbi:MAG: hypothetical protein EBU31_00385 [Proteobacteria bacterium]|nr:hypothetical protein [Pseudomonadota bacterium]
MDQLLNLVRTVAPTLAAAVGGPLAGMATRAISDALLGKPDGTQEELLAAMPTATPDQLLALKKAEQDFTVRMRELEIDLERIGNEDRSSARAREIETKDWTPKLLAGGITVGYFGVLFYMLKYGLPAGGGTEAMLVMLGALGTAWGGVVTYYFGSSAGSSKKDNTIDRMART